MSFFSWLDTPECFEKVTRTGTKAGNAGEKKGVMDAAHG